MHLHEECVRVIEIEDGASFLDLHAAIQDSVGFDYDHMFEFFAGRNYRHRKLVFADGIDWEYEAEALGDVTPKKCYPKKCHRVHKSLQPSQAKSVF
jgi:hypothetical protein